MGFLSFLANPAFWTAAAKVTAVASTVYSGVSSTQAATDASKAQENLVRDAAHQQGIDAEKTKEAAAEMEAKSESDKKAMKAAPGLAKEAARKESIRRRASRAKTLLTGPQGALGEANVSKKTLLGG